MSSLLLLLFSFAQIVAVNDTILINDSVDNGIVTDTILMDSINPALPDSIQMKIQEAFDNENSGKGIVDESEKMLEMIDTLNGIPYFDMTSANSCNYPPGYVPSCPDSVYAKRIDD